MDVKSEKYNGLLAGVSFPSSSRAPHVSLAPKTPFPYLFKRLLSRLIAFSKIQLVVYYQCRVLIGLATARLYVIAH